MDASNLLHRELVETELRFVKISVAAWNEPLVCEIIYSPIELAPDYIALSYAWGNHKYTAEITVNGIALQVTTNLFNALRQLRDFLLNPTTAPNIFRNPNLVFWIDALCINQVDAVEKSNQIPRMGAIYKTARLVIAWLGDLAESEEDGVSEAFTMAASYQEKIKRVEDELEDIRDSFKDENDFDAVISVKVNAILAADIADPLIDYGSEAVISGFTNILQKAWFERVWVVQEVVLASEQPIFLAGRYWCNIDTFRWGWDVLYTCEKYYRQTRHLRIGSRLESYDILRGIRSQLWKGLRDYLSNPGSTDGEDSLSLAGLESKNEEDNDDILTSINTDTDIDMLGKKSPPNALERFWEESVHDPRRSKTAIQDNFDDFERGVTAFLALCLSRILAELPQELQATTPHDYIYGIISMINPPSYPEILAPDYNMPYAKVFHNYAKVILEFTGDLSIVPRRRNGLFDVPTWVPDFRFPRADTKFKAASLPSCFGKIKIVEHGNVCLAQGVHLGTVFSAYRFKPLGISIHHDYVESVRHFDKLLNLACKIRGSEKSDIFRECTNRWVGPSTPVPFQRVRELYDCAIAKTPFPGLPHERQYDVTIMQAIVPKLSGHIFLTSEGTLGRLVRRGAAVRRGDVLAMMNGTSDPFLLQPNHSGTGFGFIGNCRILGKYGRPGYDEEYFASQDLQEFRLI